MQVRMMAKLIADAREFTRTLDHVMKDSLLREAVQARVIPKTRHTCGFAA